MSSIKIADLNTSDSELLHQLSDEELSIVCGGINFGLEAFGMVCLVGGVALGTTVVGDPLAAPLIGAGAAMLIAGASEK